MQAETKIQTEKKVHTKRQQVDRYTGRQAGREGEGERETQTDRQRDGERNIYSHSRRAHRFKCKKILSRNAYE